MFCGFVIALVLCTFKHVAASLEDPARLRTPPMGFNDWARFECNINQSLFVETADAMASKGLLTVGYNRINLDDCWSQSSRLANGSLIWNTKLFPRGLVWLVKYVKQKGFNFGIYSDAGNETCGGFPGSLGHEQQDANTFASWGIDYLKLDGCNVYPPPGQSYEAEYRRLYSGWHRILQGPKTPLVFSESAPAYFCCESNLTNWFEVMDWVPVYGELARHSDDIATYNSTTDPWFSVLSNYNEELRLARQQEPGYFNDPDMLVPDEPYLSLEEKKSHFALWASFSAPLLISAWIPGIADEIVEYLTNKDLIEVDQDSLALQATLVSSDGTFDVLTKSLANGDRLVTIFNKGNRSSSISVPLARIGWTSPLGTSLKVKNLWTSKTSSLYTLDSSSSAVHARIPSHGTGVYRISVSGNPPGYGSGPSPKKWIPTGVILNAASFHCLAIQNGQLKWIACDSSDGQVWQVGRNGSWIRPLLQNTQCLVTSDSRVLLGECSGAQWRYGRSGNVVRAGTTQCLTEGRNGSVLIRNCGFLLNGQVFELPSGWQL